MPSPTCIAPSRRRLLRLLAAPLAAGALSASLSACSVAPKPLTADENQTRATDAMKLIQTRVDPVVAPVALDEAIARAVKYNLDHRLALMDEAIASQQYKVSRWDLLPKINVDGGIDNRDNVLASSSYSVLTGTQSLEPSTSTDRSYRTGDLQLSWSILDFGVSYYQARQNGDRALATAEKRRSAVNAIVQQVRAAYWQAVAAERIGKRIDPVLADARQALDDSREVEKQRLQSPLDALRNEKELLQVIQQLEGLQADIMLAKTQLAALMGLPPDQDFQLADQGEDTSAPVLKLDIRHLEDIALLNRPELREQAYNRRIAGDEVKKSFIKLFPNLSISGGFDYDSNSFLVNKRWAEGGLRMSWGLISLIEGHDFLGLAKAQRDQADVRNLALSMAVLIQVNVAWQQLGRALHQYQEAAELDDVEGRIYDQVSTQQQASAQSKAEKVRSGASRIVAELTRARAYADMQNAMAALYVAVGSDPLPQSVPDYKLATLTAAVAKVDQRIERGMFEPEASVTNEAPALDDKPVIAKE